MCKKFYEVELYPAIQDGENFAGNTALNYFNKKRTCGDVIDELGLNTPPPDFEYSVPDGDSGVTVLSILKNGSTEAMRVLDDDADTELNTFAEVNITTESISASVAREVYVRSMLASGARLASQSADLAKESLRDPFSLEKNISVKAIKFLVGCLRNTKTAQE